MPPTKGPPIFATCHPDQPHVAKGLCKTCYSKQRWKNTDPVEKRKVNKKYELLKNYGLTVEAYDQLVKESGGVCALCKLEAKLVVDHNHITNKVRGLLCSKCNLALGHYEAFLNTPKLADYLAKGRLPNEDRIVIVRWWDAADAPDTWTSSEEAKEFNKPYEVISIGFLVSKTETYITIAGDKGPDAYGSLRKIPMGMVKDVSYL